MSVVKAEQKESDFQVMVQYRKWEFNELTKGASLGDNNVNVDHKKYMAS